MAQAKTAESLTTSPSTSPRLFAKASPRVALDLPVEIVPDEFLKAPKSVSVMEIPLKSTTEQVNLENTLISQLDDGRLIYCYEDGEIGLYTTPDSKLPADKFSILPHGVCTFIHELPEQRLLICQQNTDAYLVNLNDKTAIKLGFSGLNLKCALATNHQSVFLGTEEGKIIHWDLIENKLIHCWSLSKPDRADSPADNSYFPIIRFHQNSNEIIESGIPILCLARNIDEQLFLVMQFEEGFITGLLDTQKGTFTRLKFIDFSDGNYMGEAIIRVLYTGEGKISLLTRSTISHSIASIFILQDEDTNPNFITNKNKFWIDSAAFILPNGNMAFSCYSPNAIPSDDKDPNKKAIQPYVLEIQSFDFSKTSENQLKH